MQKQVLHNQSFFDVAIQNIGTSITAFDIAFKNGLSITDDLIPTSVIEIPESELLDRERTEYLNNRKHIVATAFNDLEHNITPKVGEIVATLEFYKLAGKLYKIQTI